jgi:hypothetical protein
VCRVLARSSNAHLHPCVCSPPFHIHGSIHAVIGGFRVAAVSDHVWRLRRSRASLFPPPVWLAIPAPPDRIPQNRTHGPEPNRRTSAHRKRRQHDQCPPLRAPSVRPSTPPDWWLHHPTHKLLNVNSVSTKGYCITSTGSCSAGGSDGRTTYESLHSLLAAISPGSGFV